MTNSSKFSAVIAAHKARRSERWRRRADTVARKTDPRYTELADAYRQAETAERAAGRLTDGIHIMSDAAHGLTVADWFELVERRQAAADRFSINDPIEVRLARWWKRLPRWVRRPAPEAVHRFERARRGVSRFDTRDFDRHLASVISEGTRLLSDNPSGHPGELSEDEWKAILSELSERFARIADGDGTEQSYIDESYRLLARWHLGLWD